MIFWLNIGLHVAGGVLTVALLDIRIRTAKSPWTAVLKVDWIGFTLFIISFTSVLLAISLVSSSRHFIKRRLTCYRAKLFIRGQTGV